MDNISSLDQVKTSIERSSRIAKLELVAAIIMTIACVIAALSNNRAASLFALSASVLWAAYFVMMGNSKALLTILSELQKLKEKPNDS